MQHGWCCFWRFQTTAPSIYLSIRPSLAPLIAPRVQHSKYVYTLSPTLSISLPSSLYLCRWTTGYTGCLEDLLLVASSYAIAFLSQPPPACCLSSTMISWWFQQSAQKSNLHINWTNILQNYELMQSEIDRSLLKFVVLLDMGSINVQVRFLCRLGLFLIM